MLDIRYNKIKTFIRIKECFEFSNILVEDHALILHSTDNLFRMKIFQDKNELLAILAIKVIKRYLVRIDLVFILNVFFLMVKL